MHPSEVVYLEHDGKVLLVDEAGNGPLQPVKGRFETDVILRFPTRTEVEAMGIEFEKKFLLCLRYSG
ncbi:MAG: hypothetical protein ACPGGE_06840, partial [Poseidonia sp.]